MATKLNENTELSMPIRNLMAMVVGAAIGAWAERPSGGKRHSTLVSDTLPVQAIER